MESIIRKVRDIESSDRHALEHVIGQSLRDNEELIINVVKIDNPLGPSDTSVASPDKQVQAIATLQSWIDDAEDTEQKQTGDFLIQSLDADRLSDRKLFPLELKGITW